MVHDAYYANQRKFNEDVDYIKGLLCDVIKDSGSTYIVVDGLDELDEHTRQPLLNTLLGMVDLCGEIRFLLSSRKEHDLLRILGTRASSIMLNEKNLKDIESYVEKQGKEWCDELRYSGATDSECDEVRDEMKGVVTKSQGKRPMKPMVRWNRRFKTCCRDVPLRQTCHWPCKVAGGR
jgi:hypothetical protein